MLEQKRIDGLIRKVMWIHAPNIRRQDREDIEQEARLAATRATATYDPERGAKLSTYIYGAIWNTVVDEVKRIAGDRHRYVLDVRESETGPRPADLLPDTRFPEPWEHLDQTWFWELVARELKDPLSFLVARLTYLDGLGGDEIAVAMGGTEKERDRIYRLRYVLLDWLRRSTRLREEFHLRKRERWRNGPFAA